MVVQKDSKGLTFFTVVLNRVQIVETEGLDWGEPVDSEYDSQDSNGKLLRTLLGCWYLDKELI